MLKIIRCEGDGQGSCKGCNTIKASGTDTGRASYTR